MGDKQAAKIEAQKAQIEALSDYNDELEAELDELWDQYFEKSEIVDELSELVEVLQESYDILAADQDIPWGSYLGDVAVELAKYVRASTLGRIEDPRITDFGTIPNPADVVPILREALKAANIVTTFAEGVVRGAYQVVADVNTGGIVGTPPEPSEDAAPVSVEETIKILEDLGCEDPTNRNCRCEGCVAALEFAKSMGIDTSFFTDDEPTDTRIDDDPDECDCDWCLDVDDGDWRCDDENCGLCYS